MRYVVVGGGIAGVSCSTTLHQQKKHEDEVILISSSPQVKTVKNWHKIGQFTEFFDVQEESCSSSLDVEVRRGTVVDWNPVNKILKLDGGETVEYDVLCIATGAIPRQQHTGERHFTIRDTDSVVKILERLKRKSRVGIVGNGGIATEVVYELKKADIRWIMKDRTVSATWFLPQVEAFLTKRMFEGRGSGRKNEGIVKRQQFKVDSEGTSGRGCALGPDWNTVFDLSSVENEREVSIYRETTVVEVVEREEGTCLVLDNGKSVDCDIVIWATGVVPDVDLWKRCCSELECSSEDGGILVDEQMRTSIPDVFACGDVCSARWKDHSTTWKQMRLWTQARQMGNYCAESMLKRGSLELDFTFELFAHVTTFFGFKMVFLGDFKAEREPDDWYTVERVMGDDEYVVCIMYNHRIQGAVLIGETNLEETLENLILNQTNMEQIENDFLDPDIDIEDYFD